MGKLMGNTLKRLWHRLLGLYTTGVQRMEQVTPPFGTPTAVPTAKRDPNKELLYRMVISNTLLTMQIGYQRSNPPLAKLAMLINRDFNAKFDEYMDEIYGPLTQEFGALLVTVGPEEAAKAISKSWEAQLKAMLESTLAV